MQTYTSKQPYGKDVLPTNTVTGADEARLRKVSKSSATAPKAGGKFKKFIKQ